MLSEVRNAVSFAWNTRLRSAVERVDKGRLKRQPEHHKQQREQKHEHDPNRLNLRIGNF